MTGRLLIKTAVFLLIFLGNSEIAAQDVIKLVKSDHAEASSVDGKTVHKVIGDVQWYNPERDLTIYCDTTDIYRKEEIYILIGNVRIVDPERELYSQRVIYRQAGKEAHSPGSFEVIRKSDNSSLKADRGTYYYGEKRLSASDNVVFNDSLHTLYSDLFNYDEEQEIAIAENNVVIIDHDREGVATCGYAEYRQKEEFAILRESPRIAVADSAGTDSLFVTGLLMEYFGGDSARFVVTDSSVITKGTLIATSRTAEYDRTASKIYLRESPVIRQDSTEVFGNMIDLILEDQELRQLVAIDSAKAFTPADTTGTWDLRNLLSGKTLTIDLIESEIKKITASKNANGEFYAFTDKELDGKHVLTAEQIILVFEDGQIKELLSDQDDHKFLPKQALPEIKK